MADDGECANPQFLAWVKEWLDVARERNTKGVTTYRNAYESLKACPLTFQHPAQLQPLKGFGPRLCERLTENLKRQATTDTSNDTEAQAINKRKRAQVRAYAPTFRSGAYALIVGLATLSQDSTKAMTKMELIEVSQKHCDSSFTAPSDPTKFYTAWNSMKTLIQKDLVHEAGRPLRRYVLTDEGWDVARQIKQTREWQSEASENRAGLESGESSLSLLCRSQVPVVQTPREQESPYRHVVPQGPVVSGSDSLPDFDPIKLYAGTFSVHLVLDVREVKARTDRDYMQEELVKQGVRPIMRSLEVGDAQWIAKCHDPDLLSGHGAEGDEIVLDWIVERKRLDDLIASIKDGRFHEQKYRLKRSGVKKVIYIIEEKSMDLSSYQRYEDTVQSAIASTQVINGYFIKRTAKMDETIRYLSRLTQILKRKYESQTLNVIPTKVLTAQNYLPLLKHLREKDASTCYYVSYSSFASLASKSDTMTLRDLFLKMLMTIRGVTGERALEIQKCWKTPYDFVKAFEACGSGDPGRRRKRELVSSELNHLVGRKCSRALSQKIAEVWGDA